jgi:hypothetical protein
MILLQYQTPQIQLQESSVMEYSVQCPNDHAAAAQAVALHWKASTVYGTQLHWAPCWFLPQEVLESQTRCLRRWLAATCLTMPGSSRAAEQRCPGLARSTPLCLPGPPGQREASARENRPFPQFCPGIPSGCKSLVLTDSCTALFACCLFRTAGPHQSRMLISAAAQIIDMLPVYAGTGALFLMPG